MNSNDNPLVSICIPTVDRAHLIKYSVLSALNQTYQNLQIIILNNASTDETEDIVKKIIRNNTKVEYYTNDQRLTIADNWNKLISFAKGEYIMILGDDDMIHPNFVSIALDTYKCHSNTAFVYSRAIHYSPNTGKSFIMFGEDVDEKSFNYETPQLKIISSHELLNFAMSNGNFLKTQFSFVFFKSSIFSNKMPFKNLIGPDYALLPRLYLEHGFAVEISCPLGILTSHDKSTSSTFGIVERKDLPIYKYSQYHPSVGVGFKEVDEYILASDEFKRSNYFNKFNEYNKMSSLKCGLMLNDFLKVCEIERPDIYKKVKNDYKILCTMWGYSQLHAFLFKLKRHLNKSTKYESIIKNGSINIVQSANKYGWNINENVFNL